MKQKLLALIVTLVLFGGVVWADTALAWTATLHAIGEDVGGIYRSNVMIGVEPVAEPIPAPPFPPPEYSVYMVLYSLPDGQQLMEDIRQKDDWPYTWIIAIDPAGNVGLPGTIRTATLSWDPLEFGFGTYQLQEGFPGTGPIVVADMTTATSYDVVGGRGFQLFTLQNVSDTIPSTVVPIPGTIWLLGSGLMGILGVRRKFKK